jgi:hypothetical protein
MEWCAVAAGIFRSLPTSFTQVRLRVYPCDALRFGWAGMHIRSLRTPS